MLSSSSSYISPSGIERRGTAGSGPSSTSGRSRAEWRLRRGRSWEEGCAGRVSRANTLLRSRSMSRGVSLCTRPLLRLTWPGVLVALARSLNARIACGVVGAVRRAGIGRVAGPPRGVLPVPGVRIGLLPGVTPALAARRKGVTGFGAMLASRCSWRKVSRVESSAWSAYIGVESRGIRSCRVRSTWAHALLLARRLRHDWLLIYGFSSPSSQARVDVGIASRSVLAYFRYRLPAPHARPHS